MTGEHYQEFFIYVPTKNNVQSFACATSQAQRPLPLTDWVRIPLNDKVEIYARFRDMGKTRSNPFICEMC